MAIFAGGGVVAGGLALAHGPFVMNPFYAASQAPSWGFSAAPAEERAAPQAPKRRVRASDDDEDKGRVSKRKRPAAHSTASRNIRYGTAVCVRLCDGAYIPAVDAAGGDAACQAQCPDAPVAFYSMPGDDIAMAVSLTGARYASLPVANRHQTTFDNTCTCRRAERPADATAWRNDRTLRKGDVVATSKGFVVFAGAGNAATKPFVALANSDLGRDRKSELLAMERVSAMVDGDAPFATRRSGSITVSDAGAP